MLLIIATMAIMVEASLALMIVKGKRLSGSVASCC
jgi:hypothetical protein